MLNYSEIHLLDTEDVYFIVADESSPTVYQNQAGSHRCEQPEIRGVLVPWRTIEDELGIRKVLRVGRLFRGEDMSEELVRWENVYAFSLEDKAKEIEEWLNKYHFGTKVKVPDTPFLEQHRVMEAWVPLEIDGVNGILTWPNSD